MKLAKAKGIKDKWEKRAITHTKKYGTLVEAVVVCWDVNKTNAIPAYSITKRDGTEYYLYDTNEGIKK